MRDVTGLSSDAPVPDASVVDREQWVRAASDSMRTMTGGALTPANAITGRIAGAQTGAVLAFVASGILGQYDPFGAASTGPDGGAPSARLPERDRRRAATAPGSA